MPTTTNSFSWAHVENTQLEVRVCPVCGITYAAPARLFTDREEKGGSWYCPNGHSLVFTKTAAQELREKLDQEKANAAWWRDRATAGKREAEHARAQANGYKGALTKVKKRVGNGVCPCCSRSFVDLGRHMANKHPAFTEPVT